MSCLVDVTKLIPGSCVVGISGLGVLGSSIPSSGDNGPAYTYNDLSFPADANKEVRGVILSPPSVGTFFANEDTSFTLTGAPNGAYAFTYQLIVDGVVIGNATSYITIGPAQIDAVFAAVETNTPDVFAATSSVLRVDTLAPVITGTVTFSNRLSNSYTATWSAASDNVAVAAYSYRINGGVWTSVGNVLTVNIAGRPNNYSDTFDVRASDSAGNISTPITATVQAPAAADTVAPLLTGTVTVTSLLTDGYSLSWPVATDNIGVTGYQYRINGGSWIATGLTTSTAVTGRTSGVQDTVEVRAFDAAGNFSSPTIQALVTPRLLAMTMSGPTVGTVGAPTASFSIGTDGPIPGSIVVTPTDSVAGGTFTPASLTLTSSTSTGTFVYIPGSTGNKTISITNDRGFTNPASIQVAVTSGVITPGVTPGAPTSKAVLLDMKAFFADSNIRRSAASFSLNYAAYTDLVMQSITLAPANVKTYTTPMPFNSVSVIRTDTPLSATVVIRGVGSINLVIYKMMVLDIDIASIVFTNPSATQTANITILQG